MGDFFIGLLSAAVPFATGMVALYLKLRKDRRVDREQDAKLTEKERVARVKEKREEEKLISDEYRKLFEEHKAELALCRKDHRRAERRIARLEGVMIARGWEMPELADDGTDEHRPLSPDGGTDE